MSRTHPGLVKRLFEEEVAEVKDGTVEIKGIAREAGSRTKIAVYSKDPDVDPVGACVSPNGSRVNLIVNELRGEKIDIVTWSENPAILIENALSPAKVIEVLADPDNKEALVIVPDYQLSLAIGKDGQNVRLAHRLTGFKIDIKSESQASEMDYYYYDEDDDEYYDDEEPAGDYQDQEQLVPADTDGESMDTEPEDNGREEYDENPGQDDEEKDQTGPDPEYTGYYREDYRRYGQDEDEPEGFDPLAEIAPGLPQ